MRAGVFMFCIGVLLGACSGDGHTTGDASPSQDPVCTRAGKCEEHIPVASAAHRTGTIDYPDKPPAGGEHNACWGSYTVHDTPLPPENWVHNTEHGAVVLLYNCPDGCSTELDDLRAFVAAHPRTLLTEYADMDARFAVVAWGYRLLMDDLDLDVVEDFYLAHFDRAPESIDQAPESCPPID